MMPERYFRSGTLASAYGFFRAVSARARESLRSLSRTSEEKIPREVSDLLSEAERLAASRDWPAAIAVTRKAASIVELGNNDRARRNVGGTLLRFGDLDRALRLMASPIPLFGSMARQWSGEEISGSTLYILQQRKSNMGAPIRMARFARAGIRRAARCVVVVEPRLVPLFRRTFPEAEVRPMYRKVVPDAGGSAFVTSFEGLAAHVLTDWESVAAYHEPIRADAALTAQFRSKYRGDSPRPLVGISWESKNTRKGAPELVAWAKFVQTFPATFVSLQYGPVSDAVEALRGGSVGRLIYDSTVDQLTDMDRFAAQVAAMDAVVTISNTGAHLAGAMDKQTVIIWDDQFYGVYPLDGTNSGWYRSAQLLRRSQRDWDAVMQEAAGRLHAIFAPSSAEPYSR